MNPRRSIVDRSRSFIPPSRRDVLDHVKDAAGRFGGRYSDRMPRLVLWDIDHTLIENAGVSKEIYSTAFAILTGQTALHAARTDGRTDREIMAGHDRGARRPRPMTGLRS